MSLFLPSTGIQNAESVTVLRLRLALVHVLSLGVFFAPFTYQLLVGALVGYFIRVFAWEGGSHRYFSHRAFKTSRTFQFLLALLAAGAGVRGPIWWATHHRLHHRTSDTPEDPNTPLYKGFWHGYVGWLFEAEDASSDLDAVKDLARFPELVILNRYHYYVPLVVLAVTYLVGEYTALFGATGLGPSAAIWVFFFSTMLSFQALFSVGALGHGLPAGLFNKRRFETGDTSTNVPMMCLLTMGASWHNNHHRCASASRSGFYWWQFDLTYLVLKLLQALGLVWDLRRPSDSILKEGLRSAAPRSGRNKAVGR